MNKDNIITFNGKERIIFSSLLKDLVNNFTYEFWIKPAAVHKIDQESVMGLSGIKGQNYIISPGHGRTINEAGTGISIGENGISVYEHTVNHLPATLVHPTTIKNWTHIALVFKNKIPYLYINGEFVKKGLISTKKTLYASGIFGGSEYGYFKGELRDLRVWSYTRSQDEIKRTMNTKLLGNEYGLYINELSKNNLSGDFKKNNILNKYPVFIKENIDLLIRWEILSEKSLEVQYSAKDDNSTLTIDKSTFKNEWYLSDVLFFFGCYRKDYEYLLFTVANRLAEMGRSVNLLIYDKSSPKLSMLSKNVNILDYNNLVKDFNVHNLSSKYFLNNILNRITQFGNEMRLDDTKMKKLKAFYRRYAFDRIFTTNLLEMVRPRCLYGIHFILNPGCISSIKNTKYPVLCALMQHGFFSANKSQSHDFKGADFVFLWGDFFKRNLKNKGGSPPAVIFGNPKIEKVISDFKEESDGTSKTDRKVNTNLLVLYILTGIPNQEYNIQNLNLFIKGISQIPDINVIYKLHPNSSLEDCQLYLRQGLMKKSQIVKDLDIYELIKQADIIVGDFSTSVFEAAAMSKPVIQIFQSNYSEEFVKLACAKTHEELSALIMKLRSDQNYYNNFLDEQEKVIFDLFNKIQGSSERIASYINNLI